MKYYIIFYTLFLFFSKYNQPINLNICVSNNFKSDSIPDNIMARINHTNWQNYKNCPLQDLLEMLKIDYKLPLENGVGDIWREPSNTFGWTQLTLCNGIALNVHLQQFQYQTEFNRQGKWDIELLKKETIAMIYVVISGNYKNKLPDKWRSKRAFNGNYVIYLAQ